MEQGSRLLRYGLFTPLWAKEGHEVTWWTSSFSHAKRQFVRQNDCEEWVDGVRLRILHGPGYRRSVSLRRIWHQAHFASRFEKETQREALPDVIVTPIPTLEVAKKAVEFGRKHDIPVLLDIRDEWPDEFADLAPKPLRPVARLMLTKQFRDMRAICQGATGIVGTGEKFLTYGLKFAARAPHRFDAQLPFGYPSTPIPEQVLRTEKERWIKEGVREDALVCCFFGTMGNFFHLDPIIDAARRLEKKGGFQFILCGEGSDLTRLKQKAEGLSSVLFPGWVDSNRIRALMAMADVGLAPYRRGARMALPNKPIEYMSGELALLSSLPGQVARLIEEANCGVNYDPEDVDAIVKNLERWQNDRQSCHRLGESGKAHFDRHFTVEATANGMLNHMMSVVRHS